MRAVFFNELHKGRLLLIFGLSLAVLVIILRGMFGIYPPLLSPSVMSDEDLLIIVLLGSLLLALLGAAGLFASELEHGTLPLLLGLPLSRRRIWLAKVAAGFCLAFAGSLLLVLPSLFALPDWRRTPQVGNSFAMLLLWWPVVFSAAVFFSAVLDHTLSAFMAAILYSIAFLVVGSAATQDWGATLLGSDSDIDLSLWALAFALCLLTGSAVAFSGGEMLRSRRKWLLGASVSALCAAVVVFVIVSAFRWTLRYERPLVREIDPVALSANGRVAALLALRSREEGPASYQRYTSLVSRPTPSYRSQYLVIVDLRSGRDLLVRRGVGRAAISPNGRLAAVVAEPFAVTWSARYSPRRLEICPLHTNRMIYSADWVHGLDPRDYESCRYNDPQVAEWSPGASWLAVETRKPSGGDQDCLLVTRPDGSNRRVIPLRLQTDSCESVNHRWAWDPSGDALYALARQSPSRPVGEVLAPVEVARYALAGRDRTLLWSIRQAGSAAKLPDGYDWLTGAISVSPHGRWIAVGLVAFPYQMYRDPRLTMWEYIPAYGGANERPLVFVFLVSGDGKQSLLLSRTSLNECFGSLEYVWSKDGSALYYLARSGRGGDSDLRVWRSGESAAAVVPLPVDSRPERIGMTPATKLLIWGDHDVLLADEDGVVRPFPNARVRGLARRCSLLGFDDQGRAIILKWDKDRPDRVGNSREILGAVNLTTGEFKRIYP